MRSDYSRDELFEHTSVAPDLLALWEEAGVFQVNAEEKYALHHLVQAVVCDRLYGLGLQVAALRTACRAFDAEGAAAFSIGRTILWISFSHHQVRRHGARMEAVGMLLRAAPVIKLINTFELISEIQHQGRFGIVIDLTPIVHDVEGRTGDKLIL